MEATRSRNIRSESSDVDRPLGTSRDAVVLTEAEAWGAVLDRDRRFDRLFVYAVETTGIYCRPSCPARRPLRENVRFLHTAGEAEEAGYRPCKRCRPNRANGSAAEEAVARARIYIDEHLDENVTLAELAAHVNLSPSHLQKTFKQLVGLSPREYQNAHRLERFKERVGEDYGVLEATYEAGFGSTRALYEQAQDTLGMTPGRYRRGGEGAEIRYTIFGSAFGRVLVAATARGVCAVLLGEDDAALLESLKAEFHRAVLQRDDEKLRPWAHPVVRYLADAHSHLDVPLDMQGTDFQRRVWKALQEIPPGETRSYGEVARMLGQPTAARAVARACASNKIALVIPCHRVVRGDGGVGGYRWGAGRKARLLEKERRMDAVQGRVDSD